LTPCRYAHIISVNWFHLLFKIKEELDGKISLDLLGDTDPRRFFRLLEEDYPLGIRGRGRQVFRGRPPLQRLALGSLAHPHAAVERGVSSGVLVLGFLTGYMQHTARLRTRRAFFI
jgi:hypothetical protein